MRIFRLVRCTRRAEDGCSRFSPLRLSTQPCHRQESVGVNVLIAFFEKARPISNAAIHASNVDEIEVVWWIGPGTATIINIEAKVWRCKIRLNARQIGPWTKR